MITLNNLVTKENKSKLTVEIESNDVSNNTAKALKETRFSVQFNPEKFSYSRTVDMDTQEKESAQASLQINKAQKRTISIDLTFDTVTHPDEKVTNVKQLTQPFELLTQPIIKKSNEDKGRVPYVTMTWADESFRGFIKKFDQEFTLFDKLGNPLRAKVKLEFVEYVTAEQQQKEEGSGDPEHYYHVQEGESLQLIAHRLWGNQNHWRAIADYNNLRTFRDLKAGMKLMLPALH